MEKKRIKISAVCNHFTSELKSLKKLDTLNQTNFSDSNLSKKQLFLLTESIFFNAFREYENFIRDVFLLSIQQKSNSRNIKPKSYVKPIDFFHAEKLIQSSSQIIDWNSPEVMIARSELFLENGYPLKDWFSAKKSLLSQYKSLRNHIAHRSSKSLESYKKVLRAYYGVNPLNTPSVGEYLLLTSKVNRRNYILLDFFELLEDSLAYFR